MLKNPFTHREMLTEEHEFVGRSRELANILNRLRNGSSVSLVGERRIGKSSLLYHLWLTGNHRLQDESKERYKFLRLDMHDARMRTPAYFVASVLGRLQLPYDSKELEKQAMVVFANALEDLSNQNRFKIILLLDEFEEITQHKTLFNDSFLEALRSFCNARQLTLVTVTSRTLKQLCKSRNLTSPFFNIFSKVELKEFVVDERLDEVTEFIQRYWNSELKITPKEEDWLRRYGKKHPLRLQIASDCILENRTLQHSRRALKKIIQKEMLDVTYTRWEKITIGVRKVSIDPIVNVAKWVAELWIKSKKD